MIKFSWLFIVPSLVILSGCAGAAGRASVIIKVDADVLFSSGNCAGAGQAVDAVWITDEKEFVSILNSVNGLKIGGQAASVPAVDFGKEGVLMIRMGRKPTPGYGIELASKQIDIQNQTATVKVHWIEPAKGAILAQMITSPCVMIRMSKGGYAAIRVVDQTGVVRTETRIQHH